MNQILMFPKKKTVSVKQVTLDESHLVKQCEAYDLYEDDSCHIVKAITVLKAGKQTRGHYHGHTEMYHFDEPGLTLYIDGEEIEITEPIVIEVSRNQFHRVYNRTDRNIAFHCAWLASAVKPTHYEENITPLSNNP